MSMIQKIEQYEADLRLLNKLGAEPLPVWNAHHLANLYGRSETTAYQWLKTGRFAHVSAMDPGGKRYLTREALVRWVREHEQPAFNVELERMRKIAVGE